MYLFCLSQQYVQQSIKNITEDLSNFKMAYVNHEDICNCFQGDTLLAIQAPSGTQLEVPVPQMVSCVQCVLSLYIPPVYYDKM